MFSRPARRAEREEIHWALGGLVTLDQAFSGIGVFGETGSGKTSGPGDEILLNLLSHPSRPGFFVPCAVPTQLARIEEACRLTGRLGDLKYFGPGSGCYDFLNFELSSPGGSVESASQLIDLAVQQSDRNLGSGGGENPYWPLLQQKMTRRAIAAIWKATGSCSIEQLFVFVNTAPLSEAQKDGEKFAESFCGKVMRAGKEKGLLDGEAFDRDYALASAFWLGEFPTMEPKSRAIGLSMLTNITDKFLSGMIGPMVGGPTTVSPADPLAGKVVACGPSILTHGQPAQFVQTMFKVGVQRACQRRGMRENPRPVVLFVDEPQYTLSPETDTIFQSTVRQSGCISVFLTQNLPTLYSAMGGGEKAKQQILGWLGNHVTKIFTANSDRETNVFASELVGHSMQMTFGGSAGGEGTYDPVADWMGRPQKGQNASWNEHLLPDLRPEEINRLRRGGPPDFRVEAIVFQGGRRFPQNRGRTWVRAEFLQRR